MKEDTVKNKIPAVKGIRLTNILLFGLLSLAFLMAEPATAPADTPLVTLRLGHTLAITDPFHVAATKFAEQAAAKTSGRLKVEVYPSA
jgi:TRAP-type C4-dicarboxylate transport system substrate-binding protein